MKPGTMAIKVIKKYAKNGPITLLRSWYQGSENQTDPPIHDNAKTRARVNLSFTEKYKIGS
jgi:hypothetical protein